MAGPSDMQSTQKSNNRTRIRAGGTHPRALSSKNHLKSRGYASEIGLLSPSPSPGPSSDSEASAHKPTPESDNGPRSNHHSSPVSQLAASTNSTRYRRPRHADRSISNDVSGSESDRPTYHFEQRSSRTGRRRRTRTHTRRLLESSLSAEQAGSTVEGANDAKAEESEVQSKPHMKSSALSQPLKSKPKTISTQSGRSSASGEASAGVLVNSRRIGKESRRGSTVASSGTTQPRKSSRRYHRKQEMEDSNVFDYMDGVSRPSSASVGSEDQQDPPSSSEEHDGSEHTTTEDEHEIPHHATVEEQDESDGHDSTYPLSTTHDLSSAESQGETEVSTAESEIEEDSSQSVYNDELALERAHYVYDGPPPDSEEEHSDDDRLRRELQEREDHLRQHVLQNPQPHRRLRFDYESHEMDDPMRYAPAGLIGQPFDLANSQALHPYNDIPHPPSYACSFPQYPPQQALEQEPQVDYSKMTKCGYELLASQLSSEVGRSSDAEGPVPVYRKFDTLNHRVLLHLQDEIAELEEELRRIDEYIAQTAQAHAADDEHPRASRRLDARYGGEVYFRRTELLGNIYVKLGQYNHLIASYGGMLRSFDMAQPSELQSYRAWMEKHTPIDQAETRFLEQSDLIQLASRPQNKKVAPPASPPPVIAIAAALLMFPLLLLPFVATLAGRFAVIIIVTAAELILLFATSAGTEVLASNRDLTICAAVFLAVSVAIAAVA